MKTLTLITVLVLAGCSDVALFEQPETKQVQVLGRTWTVTETTEKPGSYVARRDNNNLQIFGKPVALRTPQAVKALELATGCKVVPGTLWQDVSAEYYADMACS